MFTKVTHGVEKIRFQEQVQMFVKPEPLSKNFQPYLVISVSQQYWISHAATFTA